VEEALFLRDLYDVLDGNLSKRVFSRFERM
jgi:hypothetical protein